jgi:hypothetical protein
MLVRMKGDGETYNGHYKDGDMADLTQSVALALIKKGKAEEIEQPSQKELETMENREGRNMEVQGVGAMAGSRQLTAEQRANETRRQPRETLERMQTGEGNEIEDTSETGATRKNFERAQISAASEEDSENKSTADLNAQAREAAQKDAEEAANTKTEANPSKPATPARAPRT